MLLGSLSLKVDSYNVWLCGSWSPEEESQRKAMKLQTPRKTIRSSRYV